MVRDIKLLEDLQNTDGGWPFWTQGTRRWCTTASLWRTPYRWRSKDYAVNPRQWSQRGFLTNIEAYYQP